MKYPDVQLCIGNQWRSGRANASILVLNPVDGATIGTVARATIADLDDALMSAERGFSVWRNTPAIERGKVIRGAATLLRERSDGIARLLTLEQGKPLFESKAEIATAGDILDWYADEGRRSYGRIVPPRAMNVHQLVLKEPVGPVAAFTPWNFPIAQVVRKIGPALSTGCSIILKAAEETPASAAALMQCFMDAGLPAGVLSLVFGDPAEISNYLIPHPIVRKVSFTGSTPVGKKLGALAGAHMKRITMELGGHAPVIVARDADIRAAASLAAAAKFRNAGQICLSPTRFLVEEPVSEDFVTCFLEAMAKLKPGNGLDATSTMGPLANGRRLQAMQRLVDDASARGATVVSGGQRIGTTGNYFAPTLLLDVPTDSFVFNEEPFGPVAAVRTVKNLDEAIAEANRLPYGLSAYGFTQSIHSAHRLMMQLQAGTVWINQAAAAWPELPFGGVKDSGYGSEGGVESMEAYLQTKTVAITSI